MHSILIHWFTMSEADIGGTAVEGEPSCQQPIFTQSNLAKYRDMKECEVEVCHSIPSCLKNCTH